MAPLSDEEVVKLAKQRVGFKMHATAYVAVNLFLAAIWLLTRGEGDARYYWPIWTHLGWGLGLALHGFFAVGPGQGMQAREEQKVRERFGKT